MPDLSRFPRDIQDMLIRLPYRVGMWISRSDRTGGGDADASEHEALSTIVSAYAEDYLKSEFVQRLMEQTLARRNEWPSWDNDIDKVPEECERVVLALSEQMSTREIETLCKNLLDIGVAVAMAYCENKAGPSQQSQAFYLIVRFFKILFGGFQTATADDNISAAEHRALVRLAKSLGVRTNIISSAA